MVIGGQLETDRPEWANQISDRVEHFFPAYDRVELGETTAVVRGGSHAPAVFARASPTSNPHLPLKRHRSAYCMPNNMLHKMFLICADGTRLQAQVPKTNSYIIIRASSCNKTM
jgi:hypothetical protein